MKTKLKNYLILEIVLVMLVGMFPTAAFAEYPTESNVAQKKSNFTTTMDEYNNKIDINTEDGIIGFYDPGANPFSVFIGGAGDNHFYSYEIFGNDDEITFRNTGTGDDYFVWVCLEIYRNEGDKLSDCDYRCRNTPDRLDSYVLGENGFFIPNLAVEEALANPPEYDGGWPKVKWDEEKMKHIGALMLHEGESVTVKMKDLFGKTNPFKGEDCIYDLKMYQFYPNEESRVYYLEKGNGWYWALTFKIDDKKALEIKAAHKATAEADVLPFTDVPEGAYYADAVKWALDNKITSGTSDTTFSPKATCTRGQVATFLWRANGKPAAEHTGTEYYAEAVAWAESRGLLAGTAIEFAPDNLSPRADIVTYLYRNATK